MVFAGAIARMPPASVNFIDHNPSLLPGKQQLVPAVHLLPVHSLPQDSPLQHAIGLSPLRGALTGTARVCVAALHTLITV